MTYFSAFRYASKRKVNYISHEIICIRCVASDDEILDTHPHWISNFSLISLFTENDMKIIVTLF